MRKKINGSAFSPLSLIWCYTREMVYLHDDDDDDDDNDPLKEKLTTGCGV